ncbi:MAG: hypothetical protein AAB660_02810 [Patescibacteria group bacterium]
MVIGLDFDNVLMDFYDALHQYHNIKFNTSVSRDKAITPNLEDLWGCTTEEMDRRIVDFYQSEMHDNASPMSGAPEAVRKLSKENSLVVITSRPDFIKERTLSWLNKHYSNLFDQVYFTNLYLGKSNIKSKADACKELGVDVFVDDFISYATDVAENGGRVLLLDAPWNQSDELHPNITRARNWEHIMEILNNEQ